MEHCDHCKCQEKHDYTKLLPVLEEYAQVPGSLITILQHAQEIYGYLPVDVLWHISEQTGIKPAKVLGVATFTRNFDSNQWENISFFYATGRACHVNGAKKIEETISEELGIGDGETTTDGLFSLKVVACLGCCSLSPVMMINDETYGSLTPDKVKTILNELRYKSEE